MTNLNFQFRCLISKTIIINLEKQTHDLFFNVNKN